ncbi:MAG: helix-turn-helix domain-containing protein [Burkholderiaceae bacterium]
MREADLPKIRALKLFESMNGACFNKMMEAAYFQVFPPQLQLITEGDPADFLYVVVEGRVEMFACANGRECITAIVEPVNAFILAAVLRDAVYLMSARTSSPSRVLMLPSGAVRQAFQEDAAFARAIVHDLAGSYRQVIKEHKNLKLRTAVERLANRLLHFQQEQDNSPVIQLPYDKRTLASLLGMTPENLSRAFNTLKPYGVLVSGGQISINDPKSLRVLAKPNILIDSHQT